LQPSEADIKAASSYVDMGLAYLTAGLPDKAQKQFGKAIKRNPRYALYYALFDE
jgi:Tfp pilus assembly protein PilF